MPKKENKKSESIQPEISIGLVGHEIKVNLSQPKTLTTARQL